MSTDLSSPPSNPARIPDGGLRYVLIMPVWGDHHTGLFLRFHIRFLLAPENIGAYLNRSLKIHVLSLRTDFERMHQSATYSDLVRLVDVQETSIDGLIDLSVPHRAMTECYLHAVRTLERPEDTVTIFPTPDCVLSRHALRLIRQKMERGWRGVMVCGLRITLETSGSLLDEMLDCPGGGAGIDERELVGVVLENLHPITLSCTVNSKRFMRSWPSHVYWMSQKCDWLEAHCFHLHPLAVRGVPANIEHGCRRSLYVWP